MGNKVRFKCLHCGRCCRNILRGYNGIISGLVLFPDETELFPKETVFPSIGLGFDRIDPLKPESIVTYQIDSEDCPHLSEKNTCKIYDKRPLICRAFPLITMNEKGFNIADSQNCLFVEKTEQEKGPLDSLLPITPKRLKAQSEWVFARIINTRWEAITAKQHKDQAALRKFNLATKEWTL